MKLVGQVKDEIRKIIHDKAVEHGFDPDLILALTLVESSGNPKATRYEPNFYKAYISPMVHNNAITFEEGQLRATSFGLMQIMGQVAREKGFKDAFTELLDPATGLEWSLKHLRHFFDRWHGDIDEQNLAIASYNAGSPRYAQGGTKFVNQSYVDHVNEYLKQIKEA